jgi:hypothetical protein
LIFGAVAEEAVSFKKIVEVIGPRLNSSHLKVARSTSAGSPRLPASMSRL